MKPSLTDHDLLAYADGELPEDRRAAVERALNEHPGLIERIDELKSLRRSARRALHDTAPAAPQRLRQAIAAMDSAQDHDNTPGTATLVPPSTWWRLPAIAAAAVLCLGLTGWLLMQSSGPDDSAAPTTQATPDALTAFVSDVTHKHLMCSALEDHFVDPRFPRSIEDIGPAAQDFMEQPVLTPDMSSIGYVFAGAGPCHVPGGKTLHILYQSTETGRFISLFVQQAPWQIDLADGRQAIGAGPDAEHPMILWRAGNVMYYLVCDDFGACEQAKQLIDQQL